MNYDEALNFIIKKQSLGIMPGLSRIAKLLHDMGNPQNKLHIIHIAGTNGKGTAANLISKNLISCGYNVGLFTSPWITDYREQIQINGEFISKEAFAEYVTEFSSADATEFELLTAIMYKYFFDKKVDYAVVECGMGGKEDSTNAIPAPDLAVITSVSMDHTGFLGSTLLDIARQKAGIIKKNSTAVLYPNPLCEYVFEQQCIDTGSRLVKVSDFGDFKLNNFETAKAALECLGEKVSVKAVSLPARQEYIGSDIMIDGAHNENGAYGLAKYLPKNRSITAVIGMMKDKDVDAYLRIIAPHCSRIITTAPENSRSISAKALADIARKYCSNVLAISDSDEALGVAKRNCDFLLICGSFYLAREVRKDLI